MFVAIAGLIGHGGQPVVCPAYGTVISSICSGHSSHNSGAENYYDANGTSYSGMFTSWWEIADGSCGSFWASQGDGVNGCNWPYGFVINNYGGDQYVEWNGCGSSGSFGPWGYDSGTTYADGNGGTFDSNFSGVYNPPYDGEVIYDYNACCQVIYVANGSYAVYDNCNPCPDTNTLLDSNLTANLYMDQGCGNWPNGSYNYDLYADGSCGTFESVNYYTYPDALDGYGQMNYAGNCNCWNWYYDGNGGALQGEYTCGGCDSDGTLYNSGREDVYIDVGCGSWYLGYFDYNDVADGNCGTRREQTNSWYPAYGTSLGTCGDTNYFSDGMGWYYTESNCESPFLHASEPDWYYDGCHWSYIPPPPPCDSDGTVYSYNNTQDYYVDAGCGDFYVGYQEYNSVADGSCGTRQEITASYWLTQGTIVGDCNGTTWYSNGDGTIYS